MTRSYLFFPCVLAALFAASCRPPDPPATVAAPVPVTSELVTAAPFRAELVLLGTVEPAATVELRAPAAGRLFFPAGADLATGRRVTAGEALFRLENPALAQEAREAELRQRAAASELERARRGVAGGFLPEAELERQEIEHELASERLAGARQAVERLVVEAPRAGVLRVENSWIDGVEVAAAAVVAVLDAAGTRRVEAWATAADLARLRPGLEVECRAAGGERRLGRGRLAEIDGRLDKGGVARVVALIEEDLGMPPIGNGAELRVLLEARPAALTVPARAVMVDGSLSSVFVLEERGRDEVARARLVRTGGRQGDRVEILDGLEAGERVAVSGAELLADGLAAKDVGGVP